MAAGRATLRGLFHALRVSDSAVGMTTRGLSQAAASASQQYPEQRQAAEIKPSEFYDSEAAKRNYFFFIDLQGRLFTEDTLPKTVATCLKAPKALDQFFKALRPNDSGRHSEYPFMSACGPWETNFVKAAASPIVFVDLDEHNGQLLYGGTLRAAFDPAHLRLCPDSGRLFHRLHTPHLDCLGLLRSQLAERVARDIELVEEGGPAWREGRVGHFAWKGRRHELLSVQRPFDGPVAGGGEH